MYFYMMIIVIYQDNSYNVKVRKSVRFGAILSSKSRKGLQYHIVLVTPEILLPGWMGYQTKKEKKTEFINTKVTMEKPRKFCAPLSLLRCHFFHLFLSLPTEQPPRQYREFLWKNMTKIWNPFKIFWSFLVNLLCRGAFSLKNYNDDE